MLAKFIQNDYIGSSIARKDDCITCFNKFMSKALNAVNFNWFTVPEKNALYLYNCNSGSILTFRDDLWKIINRVKQN